MIAVYFNLCRAGALLNVCIVLLALLLITLFFSVFCFCFAFRSFFFISYSLFIRRGRLVAVCRLVVVGGRAVAIKFNRMWTFLMVLAQNLPFLMINLTMFCISTFVPDLRFKISLISVGRIVFKSCIDSMKASKSIITLLKDFRKSSIRFINQSWMKEEEREKEKEKKETKQNIYTIHEHIEQMKNYVTDCHTS